MFIIFYRPYKHISLFINAKNLSFGSGLDSHLCIHAFSAFYICAQADKVFFEIFSLKFLGMVLIKTGVVHLDIDSLKSSLYSRTSSLKKVY